MSASRAVLGLVPLSQATTMAAYAYPKKSKKKKGAGHFLHKGVGIITGTSIMVPTANVIGSF